MKQKYTITVAGLELNVLSDGRAEDVEAVVATLDRRIREIFLQSPRISKNEAALLCALDYCSEHEGLVAKVAAAELRAAKAEKELEALRRQYEKTAPASKKVSADVSAPADGTQLTIADETANAGAAAKREKAKKTSRVGNMFDLLTFHDDV